MNQRYSDERMHDLLDRYRSEADTLETIARNGLPDGVNHMAIVSEKWQFVRRIDNQTGQGGVVSGNVDEIYYMCKEFFDFAGGKIPNKYQGRPFYELSIDAILEVEKTPFVMIGADDKTASYVRETTQPVKQLENGEIRKSEKTWFLMYTLAELTAGIRYASIETTRDGYRISVLQPDESQ